MDSTDDLVTHIWLALETLKGAESHDAAVCEDRLREAMMWAERMRREKRAEDKPPMSEGAKRIFDRLMDLSGGGVDG